MTRKLYNTIKYHRRIIMYFYYGTEEIWADEPIYSMVKSIKRLDGRYRGLKI